MSIIDRTFNKTNHCLLFNAMPHQVIQINKAELRKYVIKNKAIFARYYTDSDVINYNNETLNNKLNSEWYHCLRDTPIFLDKLNSKQRYRIKKGLKNNVIYIAQRSDIESQSTDLLEAVNASYRDYPKVYKPQPLTEHFTNVLARMCDIDGYDIWLIRSNYDGRIIGYAECDIIDRAVNLTSVKIAPQYLHSEVNAALAFKICEYYLNEKKYLYVNDGERNIRHKTNYQEFLVQNLGFRKASCRLHIVYHPIVRILIAFLYPIRKLLPPPFLCTIDLCIMYCVYLIKRNSQESVGTISLRLR